MKRMSTLYEMVIDTSKNVPKNYMKLLVSPKEACNEVISDARKLWENIMNIK